jgi:hypothetical protein
LSGTNWNQQDESEADLWSTWGFVWGSSYRRLRESCTFTGFGTIPWHLIPAATVVVLEEPVYLQMYTSLEKKRRDIPYLTY